MESADYFRPLPLYEGARARGCFTCAHFHGQFFCDHLLCEHRGGRHVVGTPLMGCAFWEREPGADDE